ncbi:MAG: RidA family protein [Flavobacteriaceae bacterium]|nr:RidA family protein [Flavobacteriaceae bacterium]
MRSIQFFLFVFCLCLISCQDTQPKFHKSHYPKKAEAPFSDLVEVGNTLYLAGQIGMDHNSRTLVSGGVEAETKQAILNLKEVLELHNSSLDQVVKCTVILSDINDFAEFNEVYVQYFPNKPARTTFAASGLARNAKIEIECIAVKK